MKVESYFQQEFKATQESLKTQGIGEIWALAPINDNKIITGLWNGNIKLYTINVSGKKSELKSTIENAHGERIPITCITIIDNKRFASGAEDGSIKTWEYDGDQIKNPIDIKYHTNKVSKIILLKDANFLASCSFDKTIKIWGKASPYSVSNNCSYIKEWNKVHSIIQVQTKVQVKGKEENQDLLIDSWGSTNGFISVWDLNTQKRIGTVTDVFTSCPFGLIELPDKNIAVSQSEPAEIVIINYQELKIVKRISDKDSIIGQSSLLVLPAGGFFYASEGNYVQINKNLEIVKSFNEKDKDRNSKALKHLCGYTGMFMFGNNKYILTTNNSFGFGLFSF